MSGLARGVDWNAHTGALETGNTIAVIGTGIDVYYPKANRALQQQLENEALVITEFFLAHHTVPPSFRNEIASLAG